MTHSIRSPTMLLVALLLAGPAAHAQTAEIETKPWNQAAVVAAAARLVPAVHALYEDVAARSGQADTWGSDRYYQFRNDVRLLQFQAHSLHAAVEAGQGIKETKPIWARIRLLVRDARDAIGAGTVPSYIEPKIEAVRKEVLVLAAYYGQEKL